MMAYLKRLAILGVLLCSPTYADDPLPIVEEEVVEITIICTPDSDHSRVVFWNEKGVVATRLHVDEMIWKIEDGYFVLQWQDYWTAERFVKNFSIYNLDEDPTQQGQNGPWWCMFRNMRDLKQPD